MGSGILQVACLQMGGSVFLPYWLFGLRDHRTGASGLLVGGLEVGLFPLVGRAVLRKTLRRLSADGGAVFHPVDWPEVSRHWGLQFFGWG